jgi:hypothetical protein
MATEVDRHPIRLAVLDRGQNTFSWGHGVILVKEGRTVVGRV